MKFLKTTLISFGAFIAPVVALADSDFGTIPSASTMFAGLGAYSSPLVAELLPYVYFAGGIILGTGIVVFLIWAISQIFRH